MDAQQVHPVGKDTEDDDRQDGGSHCAFASGGRRAPEKDGGDGLQFHALPVQWRARRGAGRQKHAAESGQRARDCIDRQTHAGEVDTGEAGRGSVTTQRID